MDLVHTVILSKSPKKHATAGLGPHELRTRNVFVQSDHPVDHNAYDYELSRRCSAPDDSLAQPRSVISVTRDHRLNNNS